MSRQIRLFLKPHTFLHETALRPHETSESDHRNHRSPEWLKTTVRVRSSLLESSSNARLWGGALHDDTKNRCVTHYVHMNPEKLCRFKKWSDSCEHGLSLGGRCSFEAYSGTHKRISCVPAGSECGGALWVVVSLCIKNLWKEAVANFKYAGYTSNTRGRHKVS